MGFWPDWIENTVDGVVNAVSGKEGPFESERARSAEDTAIRQAVALRRIADNDNPDPFESQAERNAKHIEWTREAVEQLRVDQENLLLRSGQHPAQVSFAVALDEIVGVDFFDFEPGALTKGLDTALAWGKGLLVVGAVGLGAFFLFQLNQILRVARRKK